MSNRRITKPLPGYETPKTIPADLYDALELSALANGGIGGERWFDFKKTNPLFLDRYCPVCVNGHAAFVCDEDLTYTDDTLADAGITTSFNDKLIRAISKFRGNPYYDDTFRVSWRDYVTAGNIKRGDD